MTEDMMLEQMRLMLQQMDDESLDTMDELLTEEIARRSTKAEPVPAE
jgi:hypothetical protein